MRPAQERQVLVELLVSAWMGKPVWMWIAFLGVVAVLLAFDLGVLHPRSRDVTAVESLKLSAFYVLIALAFGGWVWAELGPRSGSEYLTGFVVEKTLALDNVFVIALIFSHLRIPREYQHRVLFWGILGAIVLRAVMIGLGAALVARFAWLLDVFAVFLIATGLKMLWLGERPLGIDKNPALVLFRRVCRITPDLRGDRFLVRELDRGTGRRVLFATPLLLALVLIEFVDLIFAVDSVPAIFNITLDPYIVYTSNIFAVLGLRSLYFALAAVLYRFRYLKTALAWLLVFIGSKTFVADLMGWSKFPAGLSLGVTVLILGSGVVVSLWRDRGKQDR